VSAGPRTAGNDELYEQLLGDIADAVRLHYSYDGEDPDLALLDGDRLYARGLCTLAELGDLEATAELADVISLIASARVAGDAELADAVWAGGVVAVGWGASAGHETAKELAREHAPEAAQALRETAASSRRASTR
jgi:hypothetical protein